ncbi:hypothetical protein LTR85_005753 [Meristemomyces frigidus]|nr:hypothetical protein LTR85_005753 [Meristemomyces frigidus]
MEDYERTNAREWALDYKQTAEQQAKEEEEGWQVATGSKRRNDPLQHKPADSLQKPSQQRPQRTQPPHGVAQQHQRSASQQQRVAQLQQRHQSSRQPHTGTTPRQWQTSGPRRPERAVRQPPKLLHDSDNEAEAAWRARSKPTDEVRIPEDLVLQNRYHEEVAKQYGAYVSTLHARGSGGSKTFGIWGDAKAVALTKRAIASWIEASMGNRKSDSKLKFPRIVSLTPKLRERKEKRWSREVTRQRYRQHPPPDMAFQAIGSFHWPVQEYRPEEILGSSYEALDPIRMECACYVVFSKERSVFRIMGRAAEVQAGLQRLRKTCFQIAARQVNPVRTYLVGWANGGKVPQYIYLKDHDPPAILSPEDAMVEKPRHSPVGEGTDEERTKYAAVQTGLSVERLRSLMFRTLRKLHYYRGSMSMRIRLGTFLVVQYREPQYGLYELGEYESMVQQSQFEGQVTPELGDPATENTLLKAFQQSRDLITPSDAVVAELGDVKPVYSVIFTFADEVGNLRLVVEWQEAQDVFNMKTSFEQLSRKWTRLERDIDTPTSLLDVSLTDLTTGSAWQFDVLATQAVDESRLPQQLVDFAHNLQFDPAVAKKQSTDRLFVRVSPHATLRSVQQRISYRYTITNSDFKLELSRFQDRMYTGRVSSVTSTGLPKVHEPRWSLSVYRTEWDTMFSQNERLPVGEQTTWQDDVATWFPYDVGPGSSILANGDDGAGWGQLMEKLVRIEALVQSVKCEEEPALVEET